MKRDLIYQVLFPAMLLVALPLVSLADANGPDPGLAGVPGEVGTCAVCHGSGASSVNSKGGSVAISFPSGTTYVPGQVQKWIVTIADPTAKRWGFQAAARLASSTSTPAGGFIATDTNTQAICSSSSFSRAQRTTSGACPIAAPLMYIEQTLSGARAGTPVQVAFEFNWTPPATDVGPIAVYVSANAANSNNSADVNDHIYTATYTLTPAASLMPSISSNGVVNGASFSQEIAAGSWVTIQGTNLSSTSRTWTSSDFTNGTPTSLDGVSVTIGGKPAYVYYVSPTQINVQAPDAGAGSVGVSVINGNRASNTMMATMDSFAPAFFLAGNYAIATHLDGTFAAPVGLFTGSSPAKKGETIILWGTGFGPVSPSVPPGQTSAQAIGSEVAYVTTAPSVTIGGISATVNAAALNPSALGLYQIVVTVPANASSGDQPIAAEAGGKTSPSSGVILSVE